MNAKSLLLQILRAPLRAWIVSSSLALSISAVAQEQPQNTVPPAVAPETPPLPKAEEPPALPPVPMAEVPLTPKSAEPPALPPVPAPEAPLTPKAADAPALPPVAAPEAPLTPKASDTPALPPVAAPESIFTPKFSDQAPIPVVPDAVNAPKAAEQQSLPPQAPPVALPANINAVQPNAIAPAAIPEAVPAPAAAAVATPLDLPGCIALAMTRQPAIRAAQASLASALAAKSGLDHIPFGFLARDLPIRRQQACIGINIASANVVHAQWEARYAVTRTYFSVQYARMQKREIDSIIQKLDLSREKAQKLVDAGDPTIKVYKIDVDTIALNIKFVQARQAEASVGILKAYAGLREAIGLGCDDPIEIIDEPLPAPVAGLDKAKLIASALTNRAEIQQSQDAQGLTSLEIAAQRKFLLKPVVNTFAIGADIHAKPIPQGVANGEYRPGAIGPEMPNVMAGHRRDRTDRAVALDDRASAVVDKTHNLIALEAEYTYLKWLEASQKVTALAETDKEAARIYTTVKDRFDGGKGTGDELLRARTMEDQARIQYNEALFNHALALAALERVTAGGYLICPLVTVTGEVKK